MPEVPVNSPPHSPRVGGAAASPAGRSSPRPGQGQAGGSPDGDGPRRGLAPPTRTPLRQREGRGAQGGSAGSATPAFGGGLLKAAAKGGSGRAPRRGARVHRDRSGLPGPSSAARHRRGGDTRGSTAGLRAGREGARIPAARRGSAGAGTGTCPLRAAPRGGGRGRAVPPDAKSQWRRRARGWAGPAGRGGAAGISGRSRRCREPEPEPSRVELSLSAGPRRPGRPLLSGLLPAAAATTTTAAAAAAGPCPGGAGRRDVPRELARHGRGSAAEAGESPRRVGRGQEARFPQQLLACGGSPGAAGRRVPRLPVPRRKRGDGGSLRCGQPGRC